MEENMPNPLEEKSANEILREFFENLEKLPNIDPSVATTIKKLWNEGNLNRDEMLTALELMRSNQ
jgi:DNA polymerase/3'-5' exonuclease PolX